MRKIKSYIGQHFTMNTSWTKILLVALFTLAISIPYSWANPPENKKEPSKQNAEQTNGGQGAGGDEQGNGDQGDQDDCKCKDKKEDEKKKKEEEDKKDDKTPDDSNCFQFVLPFGKMNCEPLLAGGEFSITRLTPTPTIYSPQGLYFSHALNTGIVTVKTSNLSPGVSREVVIFTSDSRYITYRFANGQAIASPIIENSAFSNTLRMVDANGNPTDSEPVYYDFISSTDSFIRFSAASRLAVMVKTSYGRQLRLDSAGIGLELIHQDNILRQVKSSTDGLADIVAIDEFKYEIRLYNTDSIGSKDASSGIYQVSGEPRSVWTIENPARNHSALTHMIVTEVTGGVSYIYDWYYSEAVNDWKVISGGGQRVSGKETLWDSTNTSGTIVEYVADGNGNVSYKKQFTKRKYNWGTATLEESLGSDAENIKTVYTYYDNVSSDGKALASVKTRKDSDGYWESYKYDSEGRPSVTVKAWKDSAFNSPENQAYAIYYSYVPVDSEDVPALNDRRERTVTEKILGITVKKTFYAYNTVNGEPVVIKEKCVNPNASYGDSSNQRTVTVSYAPDAAPSLSGRVKTISYPDGKFESYFYEYGTYYPSANPESSSFVPADSGAAMRRTITHGTVSSPSGIAGKTTKDINVVDHRGDNVFSSSYVYTGSDFETVSWTVSYFDSEHHIVRTVKSNNIESESTWNCCNKASEKLHDGVEYVYSYDLLKRLSSKTKKGFAGQPDLTTSYVYDSSGRTLSETIASGSISLSRSKEYDMAGRITKETDAAGLSTSYSYANGGSIKTTAAPGGFTSVESKYFDGQQKSVTGTAVIPEYYDYGVENDGSVWKKTSFGSSNSPRYVKTWTNSLGNPVKEEKPGYNGTVITRYYYNNKAQLVKISSTGKADLLYVYNELGERIRSGFDVNSNGNLDLASMDRISDQESVFAKEANAWWQIATSKTYAQDNADSATVSRIEKRRLSGFAAGQISESVSVDINGNQTVSKSSIDRVAKTMTQTVNTPDSDVDSESIYVNGLVISQKSATGLITTLNYDAIGRNTGVVDPRTGESKTHYASNSRVDYIEDAAGNRTNYEYELATGRKSAVIDALNKRTEYTYNSLGQTLSIRGDATYPLDYEYNAYGQMTKLKTYRQDMSSPDITGWSYQESTGLLLSKTYADNNSVSYEYDIKGNLTKRTWARAVLTNYAYNSLDEMTGITYSDATPAVALTYNRIGQQKTVTDVVGTRTFSYNDKLQLTGESINGIYNKVLTRNYDTLGRSSGFAIEGDNYAVAYGYDNLGRMDSLTSGTDVFSYAYLPNSNLISTVTMPNGISTNKSYEANRNLITSVENKFNATTVSKYDYVNDVVGRRTSMAKSGTAFNVADTIDYGYNSKSEVISAVAQNDTAYNYAYNFDNIGNRITATEAGNIFSYTSNPLNQYLTVTGRTNPTYDVDGNMLTDGTGWTYTWDAENRLKSASKNSQFLECKYDYMSRRVEKKVTNSGTVTTQKRYVYDTWNLASEYDVLNALNSRSYVWGLDLTQTLQGAGGVGGLISVKDSSGTYYSLYDANGNVTQYLDASGNKVASYDYNPFGRVSSKAGTKADDMPFQFSTKYLDNETELSYYGYRYYSPILGRWINRDPIGEKGGINLYVFLANKSTYTIDYLGYNPVVVVAGGAAVVAITASDVAIAASAIIGIYIVIEKWKNRPEECPLLSDTKYEMKNPLSGCKIGEMRLCTFVCPRKGPQTERMMAEGANATTPPCPPSKSI